MRKPSTTNVRIWGGTHKACAVHAWRVNADGSEQRYISVQVMDPVSEQWTNCHNLTWGQERYVVRRTMEGSRDVNMSGFSVS